MSLYRKTAIVRLVLPSGDSGESLPLTSDRAYGVFLTIDGKDWPAGYFRSPINDDQWRDFTRRLSTCNTVRPSVKDPAADDLAFRNAMFIQDIAIALYKALGALNKTMQEFLDEPQSPRRLVIQTTRTELHLLPWGAISDIDGKLLATHDLSVVQAWDDFSDSQAVTHSKLTLTRVTGAGTPAATANAYMKLLAESGVIEEVAAPGMPGADAEASEAGPDMLHVEAHGDAGTHVIGGVSSTSFAARYGQPKIAMLWSCFSGAANSWGDSPALCLHRDGAALVLSFQAELNVLDASSIALGFYSEVFGPAASRDPETALVHARCAKFNEGFQYACWASMTVYLRSPLDLSALPLNGPRVPRAQWDFALDQRQAAAAELIAETAAAPPTDGGGVPEPCGDTDEGEQGDGSQDSRTMSDAFAAAGADDDPADAAGARGEEPDAWEAIAEQVRTLQPGSWKQMPLPAMIADSSNPLPVGAFGAWRGNVIRLDGSVDPLSEDVVAELDLARANPPSGDAAEKLVWFFHKIAHFGSPLIVWTNSLPRHMEFLKMASPNAALTFLLLIGPDPVDTIPNLVDRNRLAEARALCAHLLPDAPANGSTEDAGALPAQVTPTAGPVVTDEVLSAAYYASVRVVRPDVAKQYLNQLKSFQEWLLLTGNLFSRNRRTVLDADDLRALESRFTQGEGAAASMADLAQLHRPEDFYRLAMNQPRATSSLRETARAKHELAYLMQQQGRPGTAEVFYRMALADLEACDQRTEGTSHDSRWYFALSAVLRDLADLLSKKQDRLSEASKLLKRAMAIQAFHGMRLQLGYSETTAARIALTACHHSVAIDHALRAANRMEACVNWTGWGDALAILFDSLSETRETARMINLANLANEKIRASNLSRDDISKQERLFKFAKARAHWISGQVSEARDELEDIHHQSSAPDKSSMDREIDRLLAFLRVAPAPAPDESPQL